MKKYLLACIATFILLPCFPLHSQEAEDGGGVALTIVPRLDLDAAFSGDGASFSTGASCLYSLLEGDITDWLSFTMCNHWLSSSPAELYTIEGEGANIFRSDWTNWLNEAYLTFNFGNFAFSAGKQMMTIGAFEDDEYDWDPHPALMSGLWNNLSVFQWGGKLAWTSDSENTGLSLQYTSSPYCERPFGDGPVLGSTLSFEWRGEYGPYRNIWSLSYLGAMAATMEGGTAPLPLVACLGNRFDLGDFTLGLDWYSKSGSENSIFAEGGTFLASLEYAPSEKWNFLVKGGREISDWSETVMLPEGGMEYSFRRGENWFGGAAVHYFPIENLRLHAAAGYSSFLKSTTATIGLLYYLNLNFGR